MPIGAFRLNTLSAAMAAASSYVVASGGTVSYIRNATGTYKIHTFASAGSNSFVVSTGGSIDAIVIGGGGGGGSGGAVSTNAGGGGGGGQFQTLTNYSVTPQTYSLTIGAGGAGATSSTVRGDTGGTTTAFGLTSVGGGGGGSTGQTSNSASTGGPGGAAGGGGAAGNPNSGLTNRAGGTGTQAGGTGYDNNASPYGHAGGGGSNANPCGNATISAHGAGGVGPASSITGVSTTYANGGQGGSSSNGSAYIIGDGGVGYMSTFSSTAASGAPGGVILRYVASDAVSTLTFVASATSTSSTITIPATAAVGDIAILFDLSTTVTDVTPSGWTNIIGASTTGIRNNIGYKILTSGNPGASITGMAGTTRKVMLVYRPNKPINQIVFPDVAGSQATTATPTSQTIATSSVYGPLLAFANYCSTGAITTRGWSVGSPTEYSSVSTSSNYVKVLASDSTMSNTSITMTDGGTNTLQSFYMQIL